MAETAGRLPATLAELMPLVAPAHRAPLEAALGRAGRVFVQREGADVWIGGAVCPVVSGTVRL